MNHKYIIIIGCGRLGSLLTNKFSAQGHSIVVIDKDAASFGLLGNDFSGFTIEGDATEISILKKAKIDKADVFLAVTSNDNINLMVAQIAKSVFNVQQVLARVYDPKREVIYQNLNITTVSPVLLAAEEFTARVGQEN